MIPAEKKPFRINWRVIFIILGALLVISILLGLALSIAAV
jgi:hypothetical protein